MLEDDFYATIKLKSGEEIFAKVAAEEEPDRTILVCLLYTSPSPRDYAASRMPSSA